MTNGQERKKETRTCFFCGERGHIVPGDSRRSIAAAGALDQRIDLVVTAALARQGGGTSWTTGRPLWPGAKDYIRQEHTEEPLSGPASLGVHCVPKRGRIDVVDKTVICQNYQSEQAEACPL